MFLTHEDESLKVFSIFCKRVQKEKCISIAFIITNHRGEFKNENFHKIHEELGIVHNFSCPRTLQQNEVVERKNISLQEMTRTISLWSKLDIKLLFSTICHLQTDGQTEMVNRILGQLLRCFVGKSLRDWEDLLPYVEFSYNRVVNSTTSHSPFELPNLLRNSMEGSVTHGKERGKYAKNANKGEKEMIFKKGDLMWVHLSNERFPHLKRSKLFPRGDDPFKILKIINNSSYQVEMPQEYGGSSTFNVIDLTPFVVGTQAPNSKMVLSDAIYTRNSSILCGP
ncbi:hypothetical protein CR513_15058, partial [Mucuna pruriens]